ncbi:hypothetical protein CPB86DRAFT_769840 [Serendipita vermifera]|nr:hypothetical protein CPB86DRAFT_769840 [Serendipita vermifera]
MRRVEYDLDAEQDTLYPADYFDLMGGVGFGGLAALLLGRLHLTPDEALAELVTIGQAIFLDKSLDTITPKEYLMRLRLSIERVLVRRQIPVNIRLYEEESMNRSCKVVLFVATPLHMDSYHSLRTYSSRWEETFDCTFVEAACATMASANLFPFVTIGKIANRQTFAGVPPGYVNPTRAVLKEARLTFGDDKEVALLLSLGSGQNAPLNSALMRSDPTMFMTLLVLNGEHVANELSDYLSRLDVYLRLSVDKGLEDHKVSDRYPIAMVVGHTKVYLQRNHVSDGIDISIDSLKERPGLVTLGQLDRACREALCSVQYRQSIDHTLTRTKCISDVETTGVEHINLIDATGKRIKITLDWCRTYEMLSSMIELHYKHNIRPGSTFTRRGNYKLLHGSSRRLVDPVEWAIRLKPGMTVEMSMVVNRFKERTASCPRCGSRFRGKGKNGWATCSICRGNFEFLARRMTQREEDSLISMALSRRSSVSSTSGILQPSQSSEDEEDLRAFRLISVVDSFRPVSLNFSSGRYTLSQYPGGYLSCRYELSKASMTVFDQCRRNLQGNVCFIFKARSNN